jgi:hypothetical protein
LPPQGFTFQFGMRSDRTKSAAQRYPEIASVSTTVPQVGHNASHIATAHSWQKVSDPSSRLTSHNLLALKLVARRWEMSEQTDIANTSTNTGSIYRCNAGLHRQHLRHSYVVGQSNLTAQEPCNCSANTTDIVPRRGGFSLTIDTTIIIIIIIIII